MNALVTGGTSGIGAATALRLAADGATVTALGLPSPHEPHHPAIRIVHQDVRDADALSSTITAIEDLTTLVNCAGISHDRAEYDLPHWRDVLETNLTAVLVACEAARPALAAAEGAIVNVSSMFAFSGSADRPAYSASKGGISQLTRSLAAEYAPIRVNAVAPGFVATPLAQGVLSDPTASAAVRARIPLNRIGEPAEIADAIAFLCSPAARYVTGAILPVDGGYLAV